MIIFIPGQKSILPTLAKIRTRKYFERMAISEMKTSGIDVQTYESQGYLLLKNILPLEVIQGGRLLMEAWFRQIAAEWISQGKLDPEFSEYSFETGLLEAWNAAGHPPYSRSPRREIVCPALYHILKHPVFLEVAKTLLGSESIVVHGIFNSRPKLPEQHFTDTPWHQDAQYYLPEDRLIHTLSCWFPLVPVDEQSSCLAVSPWNRERNQSVYEIDDDVDGTGFKGISRKDSDALESIPIPMEPGDLLVFSQLTPHRALSNLASRIRWSLDFRYQAGDAFTGQAMEHGFVALDPAQPERETSLRDWLEQWHRAGY